MKDIGQRDTVQREQTSVVKDSSTVSDASGTIDKIGRGAMALASHRMNVEQKAQDAADSLRLKEFQNQYDDSIMRAQEGVMREEGINIQSAYDTYSEALRVQGEDLLKNLPEHLRANAQLHMQGANTRFNKTYLSHGSKGLKQFQTEVHKTRAEHLTSQAVLLSGDKKSFDTKLDQLEQLVVEHSASQGHGGADSEVTKYHVKLAKSKVVLDSIEAIAVGGDPTQAKKFFEDNAKNLSTDDRVKAIAEIEKAEKKAKTKQAFNLAGKAAMVRKSDPRGAQKILSGIKDPQTAKEAIQFYRQQTSVEDDVRSEEVLQTRSKNYELIREAKGVISPDIIEGMDEKEREHYMQYADKVREGKLNQTTTEGMREFNRLLDLSFANESKFLSHTASLNGYALQIGESHLDVLQRRRNSILEKKGSSSSSRRDSESKINTTIDDVLINFKNMYKGDDDYNVAKARAYVIYEDVRSQMPEATDFEVQQVVRSRVLRMKPLQQQASLKGRIAKFLLPSLEKFGVGVPTDITMGELIESIQGDGLDLDTASPETLDLIKNEFKRVNGREPSEEELHKKYNQLLSRIVGLAPRDK